MHNGVKKGGLLTSCVSCLPVTAFASAGIRSSTCCGPEPAREDGCGARYFRTLERIDALGSLPAR